MGWPQAKEPFSAEVLAYVAGFDLRADIATLRSQLHVRDVCLENAHIASLVLQVGMRCPALWGMRCRRTPPVTYISAQRHCDPLFLRRTQRGAARGLTLYDIGLILCRERLDAPSPLERLCRAAQVLPSRW